MTSRRGSNSILHRSIKKYGAEKHILSILEEGIDSEVGMNIREPHWISVLCPDYNMTLGGGGTFGFRMSEEAKSKIATFQKGRPKGPPTIEHKMKNAMAHTGKIATQETRTKMGNARRGRVRGPYKKRSL